MLYYYICLCLYCLQFNTATAYPKYGFPAEHIYQLQTNLVSTSYSPSELMEVTPPSQLLNSTIRLSSSDIKARILEIHKLRDDFNKEDPQAIIVESKKRDKSLVEDLVEEIRRHRITEADDILRKIDIFDRVPDIVHNVYNGSESNIDILLDFGRDQAKSRTDLAGSVLFALWNEMKANNHRDIHKMITLVNAMELIILNGSPEWKDKAEFVRNEAILDITNASIEILKAAMISANYQNNTQVRLLADSIFKLDSNQKVFDEVIRKVTSECFPEVSAVEIAQNLYSHTFISQVISGLQELLKKLEYTNKLDNPAVLNIGEYLKHLKETPNYTNLSELKKQAVDMMFQKLPICARNLFFEPFVCIWNAGKREYLYVAGSEFNRNEDKRSVFTRTTREVVGPGVWTVEKSGDEFFFRSKAYENEYLFAASGRHTEYSRFVHTWTEGGKVGTKSSWKIELDGNVCYLRNVNYDEYLYASDSQSGDKSRYVFTWIPKTSSKEESFQWQIRSCDLSEILKKGI